MGDDAKQVEVTAIHTHMSCEATQQRRRKCDNGSEPSQRCRREYDEQFQANLVLQRGLMPSLDGDNVDAWILLLWHCDAHDE